MTVNEIFGGIIGWILGVVVTVLATPVWVALGQQLSFGWALACLAGLLIGCAFSFAGIEIGGAFDDRE